MHENGMVYNEYIRIVFDALFFYINTVRVLFLCIAVFRSQIFSSF